MKKFLLLIALAFAACAAPTPNAIPVPGDEMTPEARQALADYAKTATGAVVADKESLTTWAATYTVPDKSYPLTPATSAFEASGQCVLASYDNSGNFNRQSLSDHTITWQSNLYDFSMSNWYTSYGVTHTIIEYKRRTRTTWILIAYGQYLVTQGPHGFFNYTSDDATNQIARCDLDAFFPWGVFSSNL
jgi:hypothetical protein